MRWFSMIDQLMVYGYRFHPDTIIIDITELKPIAPDQPVFTDILNTAVRPPFNHVFLQTHAPTVLQDDRSPVEWLGHYVQAIHKDDITRAYMLGYVIARPPHPSVQVQENFFRMLFDEHGHYLPNESWVWLNHDEIMYKGIPESERFGFQWSLPERQYFMHTKSDGISKINSDVLLAFYHMHQKRDMELVEPSPKRAKRAARKQGKHPSPYFLIIDHAPVKTSGETSRATHPGNIHKRPLHIVRGHFRVNPYDHPLPQFAGKTFWISDHMRGGKEQGEIKKGYTICLD